MRCVWVDWRGGGRGGGLRGWFRWLGGHGGGGCWGPSSEMVVVFFCLFTFECLQVTIGLVSEVIGG